MTTESAYEWLKAQLPTELHWGQGPTIIKTKGQKVKSLVLQLRRVDPQNRDKILRICDMDVTYSDKTQATLAAIPRRPSKIFLPGTYEIAWTLKVEGQAPVSHRSRTYRGLMKAP